MTLSIVIPAYNEERRLPSTLAAIQEYLRSRTLGETEVLVVDDGSQDGTAALVERTRAGFPELRLIRNPGNRGKGYSVRNGMTEARGEWRLMTDADLSAPIEELDRLLAEAKRSGADVVIGSRAIDRGMVSVHQPWGRETAGRFFNGVMRALTGLPFLDTQCGFKLYSAKAAEAIFPRQKLDGFSFDVEDLVIAQELGFRTLEIPVRWANVEGTTVSMRRGLESFADLLRIRRYRREGAYQ